MSVLRAKFNYANIILTGTSKSERVGVHRRNGSIAHVRWLGFIDSESTRRLPNAKPVRLQVKQYSQDSYGGNWIDVPENSYVQGCLIDCGVFGVTDAKIRLVSKS